VSIADPRGKGLPAALLAVAYRSMLRALIGVELRLRATFTRMNDLLARSMPAGTFVTAFYGILDLAERRIVYANAGHPPPLLLRSNGATEWLSVTGPVLGFPQRHPMREAYVSLSEGDGLILYTDGVTEAGAATGAFLEPAGLERVAQELWAKSAEHIGEGILQEVTRRTQPDAADDATVVVIKVKSANS
jgi:sigma-B regulation protein RsbU (phosphoserine phosphatase)